MAWYRCMGGNSTPTPTSGFVKRDFSNVTLISNTYIDGTNGTERSENNWSSTDFIEISGTEISFVGGLLRYGANSKYNAFYDASKAYISGFNYYTDLPVVIPSNAKYMRVSSQTNLFTVSANYYFIDAV